MTSDTEMKDNLDKILDECIDRINRGESVEACLTDYPECSEELRPLLSAMLDTQSAYSFTPSVRAKNSHRQRFTTALVASRERRARKKPVYTWILGWSKVWGPVAAAIVIALVGYFGLRPALMTPVMIAQPNPEGNFVFLVSDEVNAISDFQKLNLSISRVSLHLSGDDEKIIEFEPGVQMLDLTDLQGNRAQEIWRGDIPEGEYSKVFLEVSEVSGILLESGEEIEIKLPSGKLQISKPFRVESGEVTNFVYDLTVVKAGKSGQYILKPQIGQSGANQDFIKVKPEVQPENKGKSKGKPQKPGKPEEQSEEFDGIITAITDGAYNASPWTMTLEGVEGDVTVCVAELEGTPSPGAKVKVEGVLIDNAIEGAKAEIEGEE
ncbi:hypothetical protein ES702_02388 [subsurface metagenome]